MMSTKEVAIDLRRRGSAPKAGSVWESRMKSDAVKGGIKVFNAESPEITNPPKQSPVSKRKTWKSETFTGLRSDEELGVSSSSIKKTPVSIDKTRSGPLRIKDDSRSDEEELDVCEEKKITSNVAQIKNPSDGESEEDDFVKIENPDVKENKPKKTVIEFVECNEKAEPSSEKIKKQPKFNPISDNFPRMQRSSSKLQSFVDLVMWKNVSKSAFVFGIGTFAIISSSFTKDLNISFISVVSYLGLVYLAAIFLFRSLVRGGTREVNSANQDYVVGEEEAIWVVKLFLPYVNEFLVKLRALFSGDPTTTMKLAVLLFILARCGSSITIWKMAKLGFIGVFIVPKVCSAYSSQISAYGTFWIRRFEDAWKSCTHKKAVGFAIFTLIWNLSSVVARIWAVFMLFVAFKYYQKSLVEEGWVEEGGASSGNSSRQRQSVGVSASDRRFIQTDRKQKKLS